MDVCIRRAVEADLARVVGLFALPADGNARDEGATEPLDPCYAAALAALGPDNALYVAELDGEVLGAFQLTFVRHVAYRGGLVAQIENVIVEPSARGRGIGATMMRWAIDQARTRGAFRVQLTSNKARERAHAFYERLGFERTHEGMKLEV